MPSLILFDFDGVLADSHPHLVREIPPILKRYIDTDNSYTEAEFEAFNAQLHKEHGSSLHGWAAHKNHDAAWVMEAQRHTNVEVGHIVRPLLGPDAWLISASLKLAQAGHELAVLTASHRDYTLPFIEHIGLAEIFPPHRVFDVSVLQGGSKLQTSTYQKVLGWLPQKEYKNRFMVEDSSVNLPAAKAVGLTTLYVNSAHPPSPEHAGYIDHAFTGMAGLLAFLLAEA